LALFGRSGHSGSVHVPQGEFSIGELVAAAVDLTSTDEERAFRRALPGWQKQSMGFYDLLGECWFPAQFYARMLSRVRLYPAIRHPNGEVEEVFDQSSQEILARISDVGGGQNGWQGDYGRLQFMLGDGSLVGTSQGGVERWEYLSQFEFKKTSKGFERIVEPGAKPIELRPAPPDAEEIGAGQARAWRLWTRHPMHSYLPDAPIRGVLSQFESLMLFDLAAKAQGMSRIVGSGLLVIADEITLPSADINADSTNPNEDPLMRAITKHVITPIQEPGSASAVAPLILRAQIGEKAVDDLIKLIQLHDPNQTADWQQKVEKTIARIAIGLDMPPEEFLGLSDANHWTGWVITDDKWKTHGEPKTIQLCNDLTSAYFRAACIAARVEDAEQRIVWYDAAEVVAHPDRGKDALAVHKEGAMSDDSLRKYNGFGDKDAPSAAERAFFEAVALKIPQRPPDPPEQPVSETGSDVQGGAPEQNGKPRTAAPSPMNDGQARVLAAAELAIEECRRRAGARLVSRKASCPGCFEGTEELSHSDLPATLGEATVRRIGVASEIELVQGGGESFGSTLEHWGVDKMTSLRLRILVERHAAATLYDESPSLPDGILEEVPV
jgi:hypothetical protein